MAKAKVFIILNRRTVTEKWEVRGCKTAAQAEKRFLTGSVVRGDVTQTDDVTEDEQLLSVTLKR